MSSHGMSSLKWNKRQFSCALIVISPDKSGTGGVDVGELGEHTSSEEEEEDDDEELRESASASPFCSLEWQVRWKRSYG